MLVLGSTSPRRANLLAQLGLDFQVVAPEIDEQQHSDEVPAEYVKRMSTEKFLAVLSSSGEHNEQILLTADTIVVLEGEMLGKPESEEAGRRMLRKLSGNSHQVITSVTIGLDSLHNQQFIVETNVQFRTLTNSEITAYWRTGEPQDKAGGYGIQGIGAVFIQKIEGSYTNVVGLPLTETAGVLNGFGLSVLG